jgi:putative ABC transport system ATP-binding protein
VEPRGRRRESPLRAVAVASVRSRHPNGHSRATPAGAALPARRAGAPDPREAAEATLGTLRLAHLADRMPDEVSLGEQQRTAIARALVVRPSFLIADEPTGRLDEELSTHVLTTLREVYAAAGTGVLLASHDPVVVAAADRVVRLSDGRVVEG